MGFRGETSYVLMFTGFLLSEVLLSFIYWVRLSSWIISDESRLRFRVEVGTLPLIVVLLWRNLRCWSSLTVFVLPDPF